MNQICMMKDKILQILNINKGLIKNTFNIDNSGIENIRKFLNKNYKDFKDIVDNIYISDMENREKMVLFYMIGYVNGNRVKMRKNAEYNIHKDNNIEEN